jgi:hypothetical protein
MEVHHLAPDMLNIRNRINVAILLTGNNFNRMAIYSIIYCNVFVIESGCLYFGAG